MQDMDALDEFLANAPAEFFEPTPSPAPAAAQAAPVIVKKPINPLKRRQQDSRTDELSYGDTSEDDIIPETITPAAPSSTRPLKRPTMSSTPPAIGPRLYRDHGPQFSPEQAT
jgi:hypothetical protein